jgi:hypothetical protein
MKTLTRATAVAVLTLGLAACGVSKADEAQTSSTVVEAPPSTEAPTTSTTVEATTTTVPVRSDREINLEWGDTAIADAEALQTIFTEIGDAAGAYDLDATRAACAKLLVPAQAYGDHAPDTEAGRHAKAASSLYVRAANACIEGDLDSAVAFMSAGADEITAATAAL